MQQIDIPDATVYLIDFPCPDAFETLRREVHWGQRSMLLYGRTVKQPRLTAWYGDPGCAYSYSGIRNEPLPWIAPLEALRSRLEADLDYRFNSVLLNLYRSGQDSIAFHSDNERELGPEPIIASLSLGSPRTFVFRHKQLAHPNVEIELLDQSLLLMCGATQQNWQHGVPKTKSGGERINLTFRKILVD